MSTAVADQPQAAAPIPDSYDAFMHALSLLADAKASPEVYAAVLKELKMASYEINMAMCDTKSRDYGKTPLMIMAQKGDEAGLSALIAAGADIDFKDGKGKKAIHLAVEAKNLGCLKILCKAGANIDEGDGDGRTPCALAAILGQEGILDYLIQEKADVNIADNSEYSPLMLGARHAKIVAALIKAGADIDHAAINNRAGINRRTVLMNALCNPECVRLLIAAGVNKDAQDGEGKTALMHSLKGPHLSFDLLLEAGADKEKTDADGNTVLMLAVLSDDEKSVGKLAAARANLDAQDMNGDSAFMIAASKNLTRIMKILHKAGANIHLRNKQERNALMLALACKGSATEATDELIAMKSDVNTPDKDGETPLMIALLNTRYSAMPKLIEAGADKKIPNKSGETPYAIARRFNVSSRTVDLLDIHMTKDEISALVARAVQQRPGR